MTSPALQPGGGPKSPQAFRTISEVSDDLDLPQHVLRFWETRFAQIKPMKRGGGRRLYRPDHVALLRGIKALLYEDGMTIKGVQKVLREQGGRAVIGRGRGEPLASLPEDASARLDALRQRLGPRLGAVAGAEAAGGIAASIERLEAVLARLESGD